MGPEAGFFDTRTGKITAIVGILAAVAVIVYSVWGFLGASNAAQLSKHGNYIDAATGKPFMYEIHEGSKIPVPAPSGGNTGYPAELCYWTKDGKVRNEPFPVLLNRYIRKTEPTFCPDCGRLVVMHNPAPSPGQAPPPLESEYGQNKQPNAE
ncbi:MAG TPA: hypothetical protein VHD56_05390 [Tepidisphaeraceae bacterium]|nr:hypothetical protein [Tepidisphaeraceae bacterium]